MADSRIETLLENWAGADNEILPPISNVERILQNILGVEGVDIEPIQSRNEALLLQILEQGGGSGGGGGLDFEAGIWTPEEDTECETINFTKTHDTLPALICIQDANGDFNTQGRSYWYQYIVMWSVYSGEPVYKSDNVATKPLYGFGQYVYSTNVSDPTLFGTVSVDISYPATNMAANTKYYPRYWMTESGFNVGQNETGTYWRAGRKYSWIAVWPPAAE